MRSSALLIAGPLAASAQILSTITGRVQTATISNSLTEYTTTWTYSNPATNYLTLTNSEGVSKTDTRRGDDWLDQSRLVGHRILLRTPHISTAV